CNSLLRHQRCEQRTRLRKLPGGAEAGERFQTRFTGSPLPPPRLPDLRLRVLQLPVPGKRFDPTVRIAVLDRGGNMKDLTNVQTSRRPPAECGDEEQIHIGIVEPILLPQALIWPLTHPLNPFATR